jgi:hypothetical protein
MRPTWLALLSSLPDDVAIERKPVASAELVASGKADAVAGWETLLVHLSDAGQGLRHVLITLDANGMLLSAGDGVMFVREEQRGNDRWTVYDHDNIGGRFETDGSFHGTRWQSRTEQCEDDDEGAAYSAEPSTPSAEDVEKLRAIVAWVMARAPQVRP